MTRNLRRGLRDRFFVNPHWIPRLFNDNQNWSLCRQKEKRQEELVPVWIPFADTYTYCVMSIILPRDISTIRYFYRRLIAKKNIRLNIPRGKPVGFDNSIRFSIRFWELPFIYVLALWVTAVFFSKNGSSIKNAGDISNDLIVRARKRLYIYDNPSPACSREE